MHNFQQTLNTKHVDRNNACFCAFQHNFTFQNSLLLRQKMEVPDDQRAMAEQTEMEVPDDQRAMAEQTEMEVPDEKRAMDEHLTSLTLSAADTLHQMRRIPFHDHRAMSEEWERLNRTWKMIDDHCAQSRELLSDKDTALFSLIRRIKEKCNLRYSIWKFVTTKDPTFTAEDWEFANEDPHDPTDPVVMYALLDKLTFMEELPNRHYPVMLEYWQYVNRTWTIILDGYRKSPELLSDEHRATLKTIAEKLEVERGHWKSAWEKWQDKERWLAVMERHFQRSPQAILLMPEDVIADYLEGKKGMERDRVLWKAWKP